MKLWLCTVFLLAVAGAVHTAHAATYAEMQTSLLADPVVQTVNGVLWVPWFSTSTSCTVNDLHRGSTCNSGEAIDFTHNCMVTDEYSQLGIVLAYGSDQATFDAWTATLDAITSDKGALPSWRAYRSGTTITACRTGINSNCDTASDANARIIIALYAASDNPAFSGAQKQAYATRATQMAHDLLRYEAVYACKPSGLPSPDSTVCWWLAAGAGAKAGGMGSTDFGYTGYFADAAQAMYEACNKTNNATFCAAGNDFLLNHLIAARFDGTTFTAPPGRSFRWSNLSGIPEAQCTNTCAPTMWDGADAPRALGLCGVAGGVQSAPAIVTQYCTAWRTAHLSNPTRTVLQYTPQGTAAASPQSGYFAQGLASLFYANWDEQNFQAALTSATSHFSNGKWDNEVCTGIYTHAIPVRAAGQAQSKTWQPEQDLPPQPAPPAPQPTQEPAPAPPAPEVPPPQTPEQQQPEQIVLQYDLQFQPLQQQNQPSPYTGYVSTYDKSDLPAIVEDGLGTFLAAIVENLPIIIMFAVFLLALGIISPMIR